MRVLFLSPFPHDHHKMLLNISTAKKTNPSQKHNKSESKQQDCLNKEEKLSTFHKDKKKKKVWFNTIADIADSLKVNTLRGLLSDPKNVPSI